MIFRNLTDDGDWKFGKGIQDFAKKDQAIGLNVRTRLLSWVNDCFFDQKAGIDWVNRLGSKGQRALLELDLRRVIQQSENVTALTSFDTILNNRNFQANYAVNTIYSQEFQDSLTVET